MEQSIMNWRQFIHATNSNPSHKKCAQKIKGKQIHILNLRGKIILQAWFTLRTFLLLSRTGAICKNLSFYVKLPFSKIFLRFKNVRLMCSTQICFPLINKQTRTNRQQGPLHYLTTSCFSSIGISYFKFKVLFQKNLIIFGIKTIFLKMKKTTNP